MWVYLAVPRDIGIYPTYLRPLTAHWAAWIRLTWRNMCNFLIAPKNLQFPVMCDLDPLYENIGKLPKPRFIPLIKSLNPRIYNFPYLINISLNIQS